jgi:ferredoxin
MTGWRPARRLFRSCAPIPAWARAATSACCVRPARSTSGFSFPLHPLRRVHEGLPQHALHPTLEQAGLEGLWTPTLVPRIGYCEPSCVLCSEVCPTGAIWQITPRKKAGWWVWAAKPAGTPGHRVLRPRPLPALGHGHRLHCLRGVVPGFAQGHLCQEAQVIDSAGNHKTLKQPRVDPSRCVGCGACEYACPLQEHPAVYVTSIGESRSPSQPDSAQQKVKETVP